MESVLSSFMKVRSMRAEALVYDESVERFSAGNPSAPRLVLRDATVCDGVSAHTCGADGDGSLLPGNMVNLAVVLYHHLDYARHGSSCSNARNCSATETRPGPHGRNDGSGRQDTGGGDGQL